MLRCHQSRPARASPFIESYTLIFLSNCIVSQATMCNYMAEYSCQGLTQGEAGYFLSSLQGAAQYILSLKDRDLIPLKSQAY